MKQSLGSSEPQRSEESVKERKTAEKKYPFERAKGIAKNTGGNYALILRNSLDRFEH